jgi:subfamily B ATP-binding cassette protein MsbA
MIHPEIIAATDSLWVRLRRVAPWFSGHPGTLVLAILAILIGSATEPAIPALMKPLLDNGFQQGDLALWKIPLVLLLLFGVRGFAGFVAGYCLARITNASLETIRQRLFEKLLLADSERSELASEVGEMPTWLAGLSPVRSW